MSNTIVRRLGLLVLAGGIGGCAARPSPQVVLPERTITLAALTAQYPLAAGQAVRAERLGASASVSYHLVQIAPGAGERPHLHAQHDLIVTVLQGSGTQWVRDRQVALRAGDSAVIPANTPHRFVNTGDGATAALVIFSPPHDGSDQVFLDLP